MAAGFRRRLGRLSEEQPSPEGLLAPRCWPPSPSRVSGFEVTSYEVT